MNHFARSQFYRNQVMMTLSAVAYLPFQSLPELQANLNKVEFLERSYSAFWWGKNDSSVVYAVKNNTSEECIVVFRGQMFKFGLSLMLNQYEDLDVAHQVSLPYSRLGASKIAAGMLGAVLDINELTYAGKSLQEVLEDLSPRTKVYVTGHSLGGALAAVYAAKAACSNLAELDIMPYTFGAPAVGNNAFADLFDPNKVNYLFTESSRCANIRDIIPYAWDNLQGMINVDYGNVKCSIEFSLCIDCLERLLILSRVFYVQPPLQLALKDEREHHESFFFEAMHEHLPNRYLSLLGLDPMNSAEFSYNDRKEVMLVDSL